METQKSNFMTFKEFLEKVPPGREVEVSDAIAQPKRPAPPLTGPGSWVPSVVKRDIWLFKPEINLYCEECKGMRLFNTYFDDEKIELIDESKNYEFIFYNCKNCQIYEKIFAISILPLKNSSRVFKFGEQPCFGPPTPSRAITLIGGDKELFHKGQRAEGQSMGIAAFAYYRRVIENQKNRIFEAIIHATKKIVPDNPIIQELEAAKKETQFIKGIDTIKKALPESLLIQGHNPLNLLHNALSKGLHNYNDNECLELAGDIREILFEFAEKLGEALKDKARIDAAVKRLTKYKEK